jgi:predicted cation transporter
MRLMNAVALFALIAAVAGIALFVWWLMMLIEALKTPTQIWTAAGHSQIIYVIGMFLLGWLGTILYVLIPRKDLKA